MAIDRIIREYQDAGVKKIERILEVLEHLESIHSAGIISTGDFLRRWDTLTLELKRTPCNITIN
jgi:hypothetical protein